MDDFSCAIRGSKAPCNDQGICQGPRGCYCDDGYKGATCSQPVTYSGAGGPKGAFDFGSSVSFEDLNLPVILGIAGCFLCCILLCIVYWVRWCKQMRAAQDPLVYDEEENKYRGTLDIAKLYLMRSKSKFGSKNRSELDENSSTFKEVQEKDFSGRYGGADDADDDDDAALPFKCSACGKRYDTMQLLSNHQQLRHPDDDAFTYACVACGKEYDTMQLLNNHRQLRHGAKPEQLVKAGAAAVKGSKSAAGASSRGGGGDNDLQPKVSRCAECGKAYDSKELLERHIKLRHTDADAPKPFACDEYECTSKYATEDQLKRHKYLRHEGGLEIEREKKRRAVARKSSAVALGVAPHLRAGSDAAVNKRMSVAVTASERASQYEQKEAALGGGDDDDDADSLDEFLPIVPIGFVAAEKQDAETGKSLRHSVQLSSGGAYANNAYTKAASARNQQSRLSGIPSGAASGISPGDENDGDEDDESDKPPPMPATLKLDEVDRADVFD